MTEVAWAPPPQKDGDEPRPYRPEMPQPPVVAGKLLRIGDRVRVIQGDHFVDAGAEGQVVNTATWTTPHRARVLLDNETSCFIDFADLEVVEMQNKPQHPTVMAPFGRAS